MKNKIIVIATLLFLALQLSSCYIETRGYGGYGHHRHYHHHGYYR